MKIFVKTLTGKTLFIEIGRLEKVEILTHKILDLEGIPPESQRIIYKGK